MEDMLEILDWAQKRFKIVKPLQWSRNADYVDNLIFFYKKRHFRLSWHLHLPNELYIKFIVYIKLFKNKNKILYKFFKFLLLYNGIYKKIFKHMRKLRLFFYGQLMKRHSILRFIFGPQQIFFQIFSRNSHAPDTHTTVGTLIRIRENIREHQGKYVYRREETLEGAAIERHKDKKHVVYFRRPAGYDNIRYVLVKKKLINASLKETKEDKIRKVKRELFLKSLKKKNKSTDNVLILNKRGRPKTESYAGKGQRRQFNTWLWFIKCVMIYVRKRNIRMLKNSILSISGLIKVHKQILKYILNMFRAFKFSAFLIKLNLKYRGVKLKHYSTIKKKTKKRIIRIEQNEYLK